MIDKPVIYVFLNKSLHMSVGKAAAQAAHAAILAASVCSVTQDRADWLEAAHRYMIVLEARDEEHIRNIKEYLLERKIKGWNIVDEGANEIDPHTITAYATQILDKDDEHVQQSLSTFHTYHDDIKVTLEIPR